MPSPRTQQLYAGDVTPGSIETLSICPPGERWLIKYASLIHTAGAARYVSLYVQTVNGASFGLLDGALPPFQLLAAVELYIVLNEGDELTVAAGNPGDPPILVHVGGLIFDLP